MNCIGKKPFSPENCNNETLFNLKPERGWLVCHPSPRDQADPGRKLKPAKPRLQFPPGSPYWRRRISTIDLLVLQTDPLLFILKNIFFFFSKTSYRNKESMVHWAFPFSKTSIPVSTHEWCLIVRVTRLGHFLPIGLLLEAQYDFLEGWSSPK